MSTKCLLVERIGEAYKPIPGAEIMDWEAAQDGFDTIRNIEVLPESWCWEKVCHVVWADSKSAFFFVSKKVEKVKGTVATPVSTTRKKTHQYYHIIDGSFGNKPKLDYLFYYTIIQKAAGQCNFNDIYQLGREDQLEAAVHKLRETGRYDVFPPTARGGRAFIKASPPELKKEARARVSNEIVPEGTEDDENGDAD